MLYPKTFYYKITDPNCTRSIKVDTDKCKTISDLKTQISHDLHISESDFILALSVTGTSIHQLLRSALHISYDFSLVVLSFTL